MLADRRFRLGHGRAFALYVAGYAFGRFWIELVRTDPATHVFGVRVNVWIMSLLFVAGLVYFFLAGRRGGREDPTTFKGHQPPESAVDETDEVEPAQGEPETDKPETDKPETGEPETEKPATEKSATERPEEPETEEKTDEKAAAEAAAKE